METPANLWLWRELEVASLNDIVNFMAQTEVTLDYVMKNRIAALAVDLRIQITVIIVPESDSDYNCARLVVDIGRISFERPVSGRLIFCIKEGSPAFRRAIGDEEPEISAYIRACLLSSCCARLGGVMSVRSMCVCTAV
ncbi:hypothetical protein PsorP6_018050 [Peronosclerospora sorghi]|uniref:Uncharacterized protein n=1 Tax=Peronosclerospora sorghi TaxID=230839 RepID=A0ACC0WFU7_9STRA|nr:hypothetical protein PsorP6_018050 [Peronosclerospora sorghi]